MKDDFLLADSKLKVHQKWEINIGPILEKIRNLLLYVYWRKRVDNL